MTFKIETIADRAAAYGMPGDDRATATTCWRSTKRPAAPSPARGAGGGPTLLECKTYRLCGHSRSDPRTYRSKEEEAEWAREDPIPRLAAQLQGGRPGDRRVAGADRGRRWTAAIDDAVAFAEDSPSPAAGGRAGARLLGEGCTAAA